jgi:hypothetical protein
MLGRRRHAAGKAKETVTNAGGVDLDFVLNPKSGSSQRVNGATVLKGDFRKFDCARPEQAGTDKHFEYPRLLCFVPLGHYRFAFPAFADLWRGTPSRTIFSTDSVLTMTRDPMRTAGIASESTNRLTV